MMIKLWHHAVDRRADAELLYEDPVVERLERRCEVEEDDEYGTFPCPVRCDVLHQLRYGGERAETRPESVLWKWEQHTRNSLQGRSALAPPLLARPHAGLRHGRGGLVRQLHHQILQPLLVRCSVRGGGLVEVERGLSGEPTRRVSVRAAHARNVPPARRRHAAAACATVAVDRRRIARRRRRRRQRGRWRRRTRPAPCTALAPGGGAAPRRRARAPRATAAVLRPAPLC